MEWYLTQSREGKGEGVGVHAQFPRNGPFHNQEPGARSVVEWWAERSMGLGTDEAQQTQDVFAGVVFVLRMFACPFSKKKKKKTEKENWCTFFSLETLLSGTLIMMRDNSLHALSICSSDGLRTVRHCWGRTAVAARWRGHFWHLLWTPPKRVCLCGRHINSEVEEGKSNLHSFPPRQDNLVSETHFASLKTGSSRVPSL